MTKYPNSMCEAHKNVETNEPVCIVCMKIEIDRLREVIAIYADRENWMNIEDKYSGAIVPDVWRGPGKQGHDCAEKCLGVESEK